MVLMTASDFEAAGLYDPQAPDAADRLALLNFLLEYDLTIEEMVAADRQGHLDALATESLIRPSGSERKYSLRQASERLRLNPEMCLRLWRSLGFADPDLDEVALGEEDIETMSMLPTASRLGLDIETVFSAARVIGASVARIAEVEVAALRSNVEAPLRSAGASDFVVARSVAGLVEEMVPRMSLLIDRVHRRHLEVAARQQVMMGMDSDGGYATVDACIGFGDLIGFTAFSERASAAELSEAVAVFEERTAEIVAGEGGRVVKLIGDGVMFMAPDVVPGCAVALHLVEALSWHPVLPPLRVGVAVGPVLRREGDYYGSVVNMASRIGDLALPRTVLVSKEVAERLGSSTDFRVKSTGMQRVKGIGSVQVFVLRRSPK